MPRQLRLNIANGVYHVTQRGTPPGQAQWVFFNQPLNPRDKPGGEKVTRSERRDYGNVVGHVRIRREVETVTNESQRDGFARRNALGLTACLRTVPQAGE